MHSVHLAREANKGGAFGAALGIMFSVDKYTADLTWSEQRVIDNFFDSLKWSEVDGSPVVDNVFYGDLMNMVNFEDRWIYKGSLTTPPCTTYVYWNLLRTIYPIS